MAAVWPLELAHTDKLVLLALADCANDEGQCWPSVPMLMTKACMSDRAVQQCIARLASAGHVTIHRRPSKSNVYSINTPNVVHPEGDSPRTKFTPNVVHPEADDKKTGFLPSSPPHTPPLTPHLREEPSRAELALHPSLPTETWGEWIAHRRERRWSMSPRALKPQLKLLAKYDTETQREIIETAMQAGWQGLFAPKGKKPNGGGAWM